MSFLLVFSTVSFTVEKHYCGDTLIDVAVFSEVEKCGPKAVTPLEKIAKKPCCKDVVDLIKGQDELQKSTIDIHIDQQDANAFLLLNTYAFCDNSSRKTGPYKRYIPPNIVYDLTILHEVFLI